MTPWIKMRVNLEDDPRVCNAASVTGFAVPHVIGALYVLWQIADQHSTDGRLLAYTPAKMNARVQIPGFIEALADPEIGWVEIGDKYLKVLKFEEHNGHSAKARANGAKRVDKLRSKPEKCNGASVTKALPEEEEEIDKNKKNPLTPFQGDPASPAGGVFPESMRTPEMREAWSTWEKFRTEKRQKLTPTGIKLQVKQLTEWGPQRAVAAIHHTITMGWTGLKEPDSPRTIIGKTPKQLRDEEFAKVIGAA